MCIFILKIWKNEFDKQKSVETNFYEYTEYILVHLNARIQVDVVYTDFSKASDKINHELC